MSNTLNLNLQLLTRQWTDDPELTLLGSGASPDTVGHFVTVDLIGTDGSPVTPQRVWRSPIRREEFSGDELLNVQEAALEALASLIQGRMLTLERMRGQSQAYMEASGAKQATMYLVDPDPQSSEGGF